MTDEERSRGGSANKVSAIATITQDIPCRRARSASQVTQQRPTQMRLRGCYGETVLSAAQSPIWIDPSAIALGHIKVTSGDLRT